ncbi:hypothetical protein JCM11641_000486 [Rhodosporidiobolus odoratus]
MSASPSNSSSAGLSLTGGIPTKSQDLAASITFVVAFALIIIPLAGRRWHSASSRTATLIRHSIVLVARIATYVIRAIEADGNRSKGLVIEEQVLLLAGLVPRLEPLVVRLRAHIRRDWVPEPPAREGAKQKRVTARSRALVVLRLGVVIAVVLGIAAGSKTGDAMEKP